MSQSVIRNAIATGRRWILPLHGEGRRKLRKELEKRVEEKAGKKQKVPCAHIDVADGPLELRILRIASAAGIQAQRVSAGTLQQNDDKENQNTGSRGKQDGFQTNMRKEKTKEKEEIAKL